MDVKIDSGWKKILQEEFDQPYFAEIVNFLKVEKSQGKIIYPPGSLLFNAFDKTPFEKLKVVLLGQDPYHGPGQAMGLSFSVPHGVKPPPSLVNIFKELSKDTGIPIPQTGDLTQWAQQGVLLLNASLTVRANEPNSHAKIGWHTFTDAVIRKISLMKQNVVFLLWGAFARQKQVFIDPGKHLVLQSAHPSPFSADKFFGCGHFCKTNNYLVQHGIDPINWSLE
jgi:uracil-DNA glycosylase